MGEGWKPIDLAPRDGTRIAVAYRSPITGGVSVTVSRWGRSGWEASSDLGEDEDVSGLTPFAWIALPGG